jgi:hypothetical protein
MSAMARAEFGEGLLDLGEGLEDFALAQDAYIYGYPLVTMEMTRRVITNVAKVEEHAWANGPDHQAARIPECFVPGCDRANADTLYTTAFFDVGEEPWVLSTLT